MAKRIYKFGDADKYNAEKQAFDALRLYLRTGNGLHIWEAWLAYRKKSLPVPENIMDKLDQYAVGLLSADSAAEALECLDLSGNKKGGPGKFRGRGAAKRKLQIYDAVDFYMRHKPDDQTAQAIYADIARNHGTTPGSVKTDYLRNKPKK